MMNSGGINCNNLSSSIATAGAVAIGEPEDEWRIMVNSDFFNEERRTSDNECESIADGGGSGHGGGDDEEAPLNAESEDQKTTTTVVTDK